MKPSEVIQEALQYPSYMKGIDYLCNIIDLLALRGVFSFPDARTAKERIAHKLFGMVTNMVDPTLGIALRDFHDLDRVADVTVEMRMKFWKEFIEELQAINQ